MNLSDHSEFAGRIFPGDNIPSEYTRSLGAIESTGMRHGGQPTAPLYQYRYNDQGQMVELVDPLGRETRFVFSEQGQQTSLTLPLAFGADVKLGTSVNPP